MEKDIEKKRRGKISDGLIMSAISGSLGNVSYIARRLNASRMTIYRRINASPKLLDAYNEESQTMMDNAENELLSIMNPSTNEDVRSRLDAVKFYLERKGRDRGWGAQQDVSVTQAVSVRPIIRFGEEPRNEDGADA